jgi:hypothetical protein
MTDLVPGKGQFRSRFPHLLSYCCATTIFLDPRNRHRHHLSATLLDGRAGDGWAQLLRCGRDRSDGFRNAGYEPASVMRRLSLNRSEPAKKSGQNIPKNRCQTTIAERIGETPAELPFIGDQVVCLSHNQAARSGPRKDTAPCHGCSGTDGKIRGEGVRVEKRCNNPLHLKNSCSAC